MTRKRKPSKQAGSSRTKNPPGTQPTPPPPPSPPPVDTTTKTQYVNRKCKLGPLLRPLYKPYKNIFRATAEEFSTLRQDAINFTLLMLIKFYNNQNTTFPNIMDITFWSHVYRKVARDPNQLNTRIRFNPSIERSFSDFDISRKIPGSDEYNYDIPILDRLHIEISHHYGTTIIQNICMHFLNTRLWLVRIFKGFFIYQRNIHRPLEQQRLFRRIPIMSYAKKAANGIINHLLFDEITLQEDGEDEPLVFERFNEVYNQVRIIYEAEFTGVDYDTIDDYDYASKHPLKFVRISYRLLQLAEALPAYPIKVWSLIPEGSHSIVHVPISGVSTMYHLFKKAHEQGLQVPESLKQYRQVPDVLFRCRDVRLALLLNEELLRDVLRNRQIPEALLQDRAELVALLRHEGLRQGALRNVQVDENPEQNQQVLSALLRDQQVLNALQRNPEVLMALLQNFDFLRLTDFDFLYFRYENKRNLWNTIFNIEKFEAPRLRLGFGLKTDGHMASLLLEKTAINFIPQDKKQMKQQKTLLNLANWTKGLYPLYKNPFGITLEDRIIGIDPGIRDIVCGVDCDHDGLTNKQSTKVHSFSVSNASYSIRSGMQWLKQKELRNRAVSNIQTSYDRLKSRKTCTNEGVMQYLNSLASERTRIHDFMKSYCHRENKGYAFSDRKMAQDYVARVVLGRTVVGEDYKLAHNSSSGSRRERRMLFRLNHLDDIRPYDDTRRTVVAYGDASIQGTYRKNTPIPVKQVQRAIAEKAVVLTVDEFRTSVTCCHCYGRLENVLQTVHVCNHRKKRHRSTGVGENVAERRSTMKCYDNENHILHRTSACPERRPFDNRVNYPLKLCPQCPVNNNNRLFWNRDVNAAANIRSILVNYINQGFNLQSRPAALSRGHQDQGVL